MSSILDLDLGIDAQTAKLHRYLWQSHYRAVSKHAVSEGGGVPTFWQNRRRRRRRWAPRRITFCIITTCPPTFKKPLTPLHQVWGFWRILPTVWCLVSFGFHICEFICSDFQNISYIKIETDANHSQSQASSLMPAIIFTEMHTLPSKHVLMHD